MPAEVPQVRAAPVGVIPEYGSLPYKFVPIKDSSTNTLYDGDTYQAGNRTIDLQSGWTVNIPSNAVAVAVKATWQSSTAGQWFDLKARWESQAAIALYMDPDLTAVFGEGIVPTHNGDIYMRQGGPGQVWIRIVGYYLDWDQASADTMQGVSCGTGDCASDVGVLNASWTYNWSTHPPSIIGESVPMIWGPDPFKEPSTGTSEYTCEQCVDWSKPYYITNSDDRHAIARSSFPYWTSQKLMASGFNMSLPDDAIITGIEVKVERHQEGNGWIVDNSVVLVRPDGSISQNRADLKTPWPGIDTVVKYGGVEDLWGWTNLSAADVNSIKVAIQVHDIGSSGSGDAYVDRIIVRAYYIPGTVQGHNSNYILGFNEPNGTGQANLTPEQGARLWRRVEQVFGRDSSAGYALVSPAPSQLGNPQGKAWLEQFRDTYYSLYHEWPQLDALACHCYTWWEPYNPSYCEDLVRDYTNLATQWGISGGVWLTEFAFSVPNKHYLTWDDGERDRTMSGAWQFITWLNAEPSVVRYAWFTNTDWEGCPNGPNCPGAPLIISNTLTLTFIGEMYKPFGP